ncbi:MAG: Asp-tRNA(Asn)/Glu-tRNA(Gln) amidotransferase subunit GatC [Firmicutes bacterium]|nr:Asp-tRNA(Asn)/Glu-tRNA(Gln) amidotransferase subunit GatC [Bacillota bacterium]
MALSKEEFEKLAVLSRLRFSDEEAETFRNEMDDIIAFADTINNAVSGGTDDIKNISENAVVYTELRADEVVDSLPNEKILSNVEGSKGFFSVKRCVK